MVRHALIFLLLLLRGSAGTSSEGMSYVEGRCGRELRALPGVRRFFTLLCDSDCCETCNFGGVEVVGAAGSGTIGSAPSAGPPNEKPKSTALISRVLYHQLAQALCCGFAG